MSMQFEKFDAFESSSKYEQTKAILKGKVIVFLLFNECLHKLEITNILTIREVNNMYTGK